jgi:hypothetical protein
MSLKKNNHFDYSQYPVHGLANANTAVSKDVKVAFFHMMVIKLSTTFSAMIKKDFKWNCIGEKTTKKFKRNSMKSKKVLPTVVQTNN